MEKNLVFGGKCTGLLAIYDQELQCWKTCQLSLFEEVERYSEALPKSGMMQNGQLYQLDNLEPHTLDADGFLLPTPTAQPPGRCEIDRSRINPQKGINQRFYTKNGRHTQRGLQRLIDWGMLPTPTATANQAAPSMRKLWKGMLPTPTASEHKYRLKGDSQQSKCLEAKARIGHFGKSGQLNPRFVEWMMGFPIGWLD